MAEALTLGERAADTVASMVGSWRFLIIQTILLMLWVAWNVDGPVDRWDVYPFVFLNLMLSFQAAYTGPVVMISQNRQAQRDRHMAEDMHRIGRATLAVAEAILGLLEEQRAQAPVQVQQGRPGAD